MLRPCQLDDIQLRKAFSSFFETLNVSLQLEGFQIVNSLKLKILNSWTVCSKYCVK